VYGIWKNNAERKAENSQSTEGEELDAQRGASKVGEVITEIPL
jgi:hypothetical protein